MYNEAEWPPNVRGVVKNWERVLVVKGWINKRRGQNEHPSTDTQVQVVYNTEKAVTF